MISLVPAESLIGEIKRFVLIENIFVLSEVNREAKSDC